MRLTGIESFNGVFLEVAELKDGLSVVTGLNGCGKTRLLTALSSGSAIEVEIQGVQVPSSKIMLVHIEKNSTLINNSYSEASFQVEVSSIIDLFTRDPYVFDKETSPPMQRHETLSLDYSGFSHEQIYTAVRAIAQKLSKKPSDLTVGEIKGHYLGNPKPIFSGVDLSSIFNRYFMLRQQHGFNEYKASRGKSIYYVPENEFSSIVGSPPWDQLNNIISKLFRDKYFFSFPTEEAEDHNFEVKLFEKGSGREVYEGHLSSGERTLLWVALAMFNTQYAADSKALVPKLLLLDEPDSSLHPSMVIQLIDFLKSFHEIFNTSVIITTHSPTTVALAPDESIYAMSPFELKNVSRDYAIAELLSGVSQVAIDPQNRKNVFVESFSDVMIYTDIYNFMKANRYLSSQASLSFHSSGNKVDDTTLEQGVKKYLEVKDSEKIRMFIERVNGVGSCSHVTKMVDTMSKGGFRQVRGLVDWDQKNTASDNIKVLGSGYCHTIENLALDPLCILLILNLEDPRKYSIYEFCGQDVGVEYWLSDEISLQKSIDYFISKVLNRSNACDACLTYCLGLNLKTDSRYLLIGKELEGLVLDAFSELKRYLTLKKGYDLSYQIVYRAMLNISRGRFIPEHFRIAFEQLSE